jgi:hypothetical protein
MQRNCDVCGRSYAAKRSTSKFCSDTCRQRAARAPGAPEASESGLVAVITRDLKAAGRLETAAGQQALILAGRLGWPMDSGSSQAALSRALTEVLAVALDGAAAADPLDELRARRAAKSAG